MSKTSLTWLGAVLGLALAGCGSAPSSWAARTLALAVVMRCVGGGVLLQPASHKPKPAVTIAAIALFIGMLLLAPRRHRPDGAAHPFANSGPTLGHA